MKEVKNNKNFLEQRKYVDNLLQGGKIHPLEVCKQLYEKYDIVENADGKTAIVVRSTGEQVKPETYSKGVDGYNLLSHSLNFAKSWLEAHLVSVSQSGVKNGLGYDERVYEYAFNDGAFKTFDAITTTMRNITQSGEKLSSDRIIDSTEQTFQQLNGYSYKYTDIIAYNLINSTNYLGVDRSNHPQYLGTKSFLTAMANHCESQNITRLNSQTSTQTSTQTNTQQTSQPDTQTREQLNAQTTPQTEDADEKFELKGKLVDNLLQGGKIHPLEACKQLYEKYDMVKNANGTTSIVVRETGEEVKPETYAKGPDGYNILSDALNFTNSWLQTHNKCVSQTGAKNEFGYDERVYEYAFNDGALKTFDAITTTMQNIVQSGEPLTSDGIMDSTEETFEQLNGYSYKYTTDIVDNLLADKDFMTGVDRSSEPQFLATKSFLTTMANHYQSEAVAAPDDVPEA